MKVQKVMDKIQIMKSRKAEKQKSRKAEKQKKQGSGLDF